MLLDLFYRQLAVMEQARGERGVTAGLLEHLGKMREAAAAARGDDRDADSIREIFEEFEKRLNEYKKKEQAKKSVAPRAKKSARQ